MIASVTTLTNASDKQAIVKSIETVTADELFTKNMAISEKNCKKPIKMMYDFRLVPAMGTLSEMRP